ncbi:Cullin repeat-like-containing domain protein [Epithele typhae]|uniref:Cullin repeat-like-containing domain protein n=1 Tax=Epithele typhae TaxID=378194 RepID=UPI002008EB58|nr:Cullin repeat-like-containing domain protein [Epithele typhae]KAH9930452.1 Cullin repeat-like-containing domain protein [Epithele typhae]
MDDETAEIELLEQNLNKTRQISQRMTSILSSFDTRLVKLEKSILPLYTSTQLLTRRSNNIENTLQKIDEIASYHEGVAAEEALILRGPQPGQLNAYTEVLERMNASVAFNSTDSRDKARLVETGAKKLIQMYTKIVAEGSSGVPPGGTEFTSVPFPAQLLVTLKPLVVFLRTLPLPATHPSHPAAPGIQSALKDAQKGYGDMRGSWVRKCLETFGKRVVDRAETIEGVAAGREVGVWTENMLTVAEEEYSLLLELASLNTPNMLASTYAALISPLTLLFTSTLGSLGSLIKRNLNKNTFLALSAYSSLTALQLRWNDSMCRRADRKENELKEGLHSIRASCLRSFPEFLADIKVAGMGPKGGEVGTGLAEFTITTVIYLEQLLVVQEGASAALLTLGDGNWKMGQGTQIGKTKPGEVDEKMVLEHFTFDVVQSTIQALLALSRMNKRPAYGAIFLLNNVSFLRTQLLVERNSITQILSRPSVEFLNTNFRTAKAGYFDANFSPLLQTLVDERDKGKSAVKEKFTRFFDLLDEVSERHMVARVLVDDPEGRATVADEAGKLVVPSLQRFIQRNLGKEFSKNPQKYIKMPPEDVEALIKGFYTGGTSSLPMPPPQEKLTNTLLQQAGWGW